MTIEELMERIQLPEEAQKIVLEGLMDEDEYQEWKRLFYSDLKAVPERLKECEDSQGTALELLLRLGAEVYKEYQRKGISDQIYEDSFSDITIWCRDCFFKKGIWGVEEVLWLAKTVKMELFRLGRLQFEPAILEEDLTGQTHQLKKGIHVLNVHIPEDGKLDYEKCMESFDRARAFFGDTFEAFVCDSWLHDPALKEFLPAESNIVRFQNLFEIVKIHHPFPLGESRIFKTVREDKENYPEDTLLQRKAKEYLLSGKEIQMGIGIFYK